MKIVKSSGCTAFYTDVDGKELNELSKEEKESLLEKLIKIHNIQGLDSTINLLLDNIEYEGEDGGRCDQCGDSVYRQYYDLTDYDKYLINDDSSNRE